MESNGKSHPLCALNFTRDESMFTNLPHNINREIDKNHVKTLTRSLNLIGSLRAVIAAHLSFLDPNLLYVIDGQHLIEGSKASGDEIAFLEIRIASPLELITVISMLNSSSKNWKTEDYVLSWSWLSKDYHTLYGISREKKVSVAWAACAFSLLTTRGTKSKNVLKNGDFKILDEVSGKKIIDYLIDVFTIIGKNNRDKTGYNHAAFKDYMVKHAREIYFFKDKKDDFLKFFMKYKK